MKNLILMTAIGIILFMSRGIVGPINSLYVESLGANYVMIGVLGAIISLTTIAFSYVWGRLSDRRGKRKLFLVGGLAVLFGNLAPKGAIVKQSAVAPEMLKHEGPARVFDSEDEAAAAIFGGKVKPGDVLELEKVAERFEGKVWVSAVRHEIAEGNWLTDVQFGLQPQWFFEKHALNKIGAAITPIHVDVNIVNGVELDIEAFRKSKPEYKDAILVCEDGWVASLSCCH